MAAQAQAPTRINAVLNFAADGGAAGFYHALERGYFRELGLDVTIEPSKGSADAITRTASQSADIGVGDISTLVEFASRRPEIAPKALFILHNRSPQSVVALHSAENRTESRGAHARDDFPERDDENWLKHTAAWLDGDGKVTIGYRPVHLFTLSNEVQPFPPKARSY